MSAITARRCLVAVAGAASAIATGAGGHDCSQTGCPLLVFPYEPGCWNVVEESVRCRARLARLDYEEGPPEPPDVVGAGECDTCGSSTPQNPHVTYTEITGWQFCLTVSGGVEFKAPVGPQWHVTVSGAVCYDTRQEEAVTLAISCPARGRVAARALETRVPMRVHAIIDFRRVGLLEREVPVPPGCWGGDAPAQYNVWHWVRCHRAHQYTSTEKFRYTFQYEDLECPQMPAG